MVGWHIVSYEKGAAFGRWTALILRDLLSNETFRYQGPLKLFVGIKSNILSNRLKMLKACGLVEHRL